MFVQDSVSSSSKSQRSAGAKVARQKSQKGKAKEPPTGFKWIEVDDGWYYKIEIKSKNHEVKLC